MRFAALRLRSVQGGLLIALLSAGSLHAADGDGRYYIELIAGNETLEAVAAGRTRTLPPEQRVEEASDRAFIVLERINGEWVPCVAGIAPQRGFIRSADRQGDVWTVGVEGIIGGLPRRRAWLESLPLPLRYELSFKTEDGRISGTLKGTVGHFELRGKKRVATLTSTVDDQPIEGSIGGSVAALSSIKLPPAPEPGEHPRFLFRKEQLPALKQKARTPWGQAMMARLDQPGWSRSGMAVAQGLLFQLTGDRRHADQARELIDADIKSGWWATLGPIHDPAHKATEAMIAYDLIYEACDEAYRAGMREFLRDKMYFMKSYANINSGNGHLHSNWSAQYRAATGMIALLLLADPEPSPAVPSAWELPVLSPPAGFGVKPGVPVLPIDKSPLRNWLMCGPLNIGIGNDGLTALGGELMACPAAGVEFETRVKAKERQDLVCGKYPEAILYKNARPRPKNKSVTGDDLQPLTKTVSAAFNRVPKEAVCRQGEYGTPPGWVHLWRACGLKSFQTLYFFAVLDVPEARNVQIKLGGTGDRHDWIHADSTLIISGRRFRHADVCRLEPGKHPVLRKVTISMLRDAHGRHNLIDEVFLEPIDDAQARQAVEICARNRRFAQQRIEAGKSRWDALGRPDPDALYWRAYSRLAMDRYCSTAIGDRGWHCAGQCYTQHPMRTVQPYVHCYRNATGTDVGEHIHAGWFLGQAAMRTVFSDTWARMQDYGRGDGPVGVDVFGRGFANVPEAMKPIVFEAWKRTLELTDKGLFDSPELAVTELDPMSAAFTFVNWPDASALAARPSACPLALVDRQRLGYTMRNRWKDADDIVAVFTGFRHPGGDWGCEESELDLRLLGLGDRWIEEGKPSNRVGGDWAAGITDVRQRHLATSPDGSAIITLEYGAPEGGVGLRCFAVDYSGKAGVPALFAVVDRPLLRTSPKAPEPGKKKPEKRRKVPSLDGLLDGNEGEALDLGIHDKPEVVYKTHWQLVTHVDNEVNTGAGAFRITGKQSGVLAGTVVAPAGTKVTADEDLYKTEINYRFDHQWKKFSRQRIRVPGNEFYFVVMTLGTRPAPKPAVTGSGPDAVVKVGKRTVRFDGEKVVFD